MFPVLMKRRLRQLQQQSSSSSSSCSGRIGIGGGSCIGDQRYHQPSHLRFNRPKTYTAYLAAAAVTSLSVVRTSTNIPIQMSYGFRVESFSTTTTPTISTTTIAAIQKPSTMDSVAEGEMTPPTTVPPPPPPRRPQLPLRFDDSALVNHVHQASATVLNLSDLSQIISIQYEQKQSMYAISRDIQNQIQHIRTHIGTHHAQNEIDQLIEQYRHPSGADNSHNDDFHNQNESIEGTSTNPSSSMNTETKIPVLTFDKATNRIPRIANLSYTVEDLIRTISYHHFLQTGTVMAPIPYGTDEEYISGAIMGLCMELQHYGLGRATVRDVESVQMACTVVSACMEYLLSFDFRNGPLRRKYDGCKYSLKALETFLYELAVTSPVSTTGATTTTTGSESNESNLMPELRLEDVLPMPELLAVKERMEFRDELRESVIKKSRDGQKLAKQCIFALHRKDRNHAKSLLQQCCSYIQSDLFPIIQEEPPLRYGSFASVLEEYVEAKLFYTWLHGRDPDTIIMSGSCNNSKTMAASTDTVSGMACGIILIPQDFVMDDFIQLEPDEYLGGLCDLTGEIGRYAVQRATVRDVPSIRQCLYSNTLILNAIQSMDRMTSGGNGSIMKKIDTVKQSVQKLERMLYEISLSEAAGHGRMVQTAVPTLDTTTNLDDE